MSKWTVEAEFSLTTTIEPDSIQFDEGDSEEFEDNSYFSGESITCSGGSLSFVIEADDDYDAHRAAEEIISDGGEVSDYNGLTWLVEDVQFTVTEVEEPMTLERATEILNRVAADSGDEVEKAVEFVLAAITAERAKVAAQQSQINALVASVEELKQTVAKLTEMVQLATQQADERPAVTNLEKAAEAVVQERQEDTWR
jgi:hypothetical protein